MDKQSDVYPKSINLQTERRSFILDRERRYMSNRRIVLTLTLAFLGVLVILNAVPSFAQNMTLSNTTLPANQSMSTNSTAGLNSTAEMAGLEGESGQISGCKRCR